MRNKIPTHKAINRDNMFVTWDDDAGRTQALRITGDALLKSENVTKGRHSNFRDLVPNINTGVEFTKRDYDFFRPSERVPTRPDFVMADSMASYRTVGLIRNVIDLMGDFASQGVELTHPNPKIQKFYREWFKKVSGKDRSERFLNLLYRVGNIFIKVSTAKLKTKDVKNLQRGTASPDVGIEPLVPLQSKEIPWRYTFLNPLAITHLGTELSSFIETARYGLQIPNKVASNIQNPNNQSDRDMIAKLPADIRRAVMNGDKVFPLDPDKLRVFFYKKDDWTVFADPMLYPLSDDIKLLGKMKLADSAALDGVISHIRLWTLGDIENKILPTPEAINKLSDILTNNVGGGTIDLIWGPAIKLQETGTEVQAFLGREKYEPVWEALHSGLGLPPSLTGSSNTSNFTNNFISLKTMVERLNYGRDVLTTFWEEQIKWVQRAMGFRFPAEVRFTRMVLTDEASEKALLVQLLDRGIISDKTVLERFNESSSIESTQISREDRAREKGARKKAGPWNSPQISNELKKIGLQQGIVTPTEVGLELEERKDGETTSLDLQKEGNELQKKADKGIPQQGRPRNSKDTVQRKPRRTIPRTSAILNRWADVAQKQIAEVINPTFLNSKGKKNMRSLSSDEFAEVEELKFAILCNTEPFEKISAEVVLSKLNNPLPVSNEAIALRKDHTVYFVEMLGYDPGIDDTRFIQSAVYVVLAEQYFNEESDNG